MQNLRKIDWLDDSEDQDLRERIAQLIMDEGIRTAILKDIHLVEAALASDRIVVSLDEKVRGYLSKISNEVVHIASIHWVNPEMKNESAVRWLERGAPHETARLLAYREK